MAGAYEVGSRGGFRYDFAREPDRMPDYLTTAKERIAEEARQRTGTLDLSRLWQLEGLPDEISNLTGLERLDCSFTQVSTLSQVSKLHSLQQLDCNHTKVSDLSPLANLAGLRHVAVTATTVASLAPLAGLRSLQRVECGGTRVHDLTPLAKLNALQHLECGHTEVSDLALLSRFESLQHLECAETKVQSLTPLTGLTNLRHLNCVGLQVNDLSPLASLPKLRSLECVNVQVGDLSVLTALTGLQRLSCGHKDLVTDLSPLAALVDLRYLSCQAPKVSRLEPLAKLTELRNFQCGCFATDDLSPLAELINLFYLQLSRTQVSDLTPLRNLTALEILFCSSTRINDLSILSGLPLLKELGVSYTGVSDLSPLASLARLERLDCSSTRVTDLSPLFGLEALAELDCSHCHLRDLPAEIVDKPSLRALYAYKTTVPSLPHGVLSKQFLRDCLTDVRAYFADLALEAAKLADVKLLLLGNSGVGKTQIARWLADEPFDPSEPSTHGIQIVGQPKVDSLAARLRLRIWDFGGQDIYHGTHALFIHAPAIVMAVWEVDRENRHEYEQDGLVFRNYPFAYWVDVAQLQGHPDSQILLVQSKCDDINQEKRVFPIADEKLTRPMKELRVSARERRGQGALEDALCEAITKLHERGLPKIGAAWLRVQRRIEALLSEDMALPAGQRRHQLIDRSTFESICAEEGGIASTEALLGYLDANGTVFYRPDLFHKRIVLDQSWAFDAIYSVFDRKQVYLEVQRTGGRFRFADIGQWAWQKRSDDERKLLIDVMLSCDICFVYRHYEHGTEYIAPDLLPERAAVACELAARWSDDRASRMAVFHHNLLHSGLIRSIMAKIGHAAGVNALYWRSGVCAFDTRRNSRVLIEEEYTGEWQGVIRVQTQDGEASALLELVVILVGHVQDSLGLRPFDVDLPPASERVEPPTPSDLAIGRDKSARRKLYVSYAWGDDTPKGRKRQEDVDRACARAEQNCVVLRDDTVLKQRDRISVFMEEMGNADRILLMLSDKYLRSPFCMFELFEIWRTSKQDPKIFLDRLIVWKPPELNISSPTHRSRPAAYWKRQHEKVERETRHHGSVPRGKDGQVEAKQMLIWYTQLPDILALFSDQVLARSIDELEFD